MSDLKNLRDLTLACLKEGVDWYSHDDLVKGNVSSFDHDFVTAFAPVVVLGLIDQLEAAQKDAARYRVFRANEDGVSVASTWNGNTGATPYINGKELDECADSWLAFEENKPSQS